MIDIKGLLISAITSKIQINHDELLVIVPVSNSNICKHLKLLVKSNHITKARVGRYVYYMMPDIKVPVLPEIDSVISNHCSLAFRDIVKKSGLDAVTVSKQIAYLLHKEILFKQSNNDKDVLYTKDESLAREVQEHVRITKEERTIGPYLREFLFGLPILV
jgi:hypothetical protein